MIATAAQFPRPEVAANLDALDLTELSQDEMAGTDGGAIALAVAGYYMATFLAGVAIGIALNNEDEPTVCTAQ